MFDKIVIANWKANPASLSEAQDLFKAEIMAAERNKIKVIVCPPFVFLEELAQLLPADFSEWASLGVQNIWESAGPFTGEISPEMVHGLGARFVLVGHSDRRYVLGESDEMIHKKVLASLRVGMTPVLLVGGKDQQKEAGEKILTEQLRQDLATLRPEDIAKVWIAYEPVWAISTNFQSQPVAPDDAVAAMVMIRDIVFKKWQVDPADVKVLYGGSVNEGNITQFLKRPEIDGAVVGAASLKAAEFDRLLNSVRQIL